MFDSKKGPLGITILAPTSYSENPGQCDVDIVAVHGLNGDSIGSWSSGDCCWIRDLLPKSCSTARIMTYGYNANLISDTASGRIADYAEDLLAELHSYRNHDQARERPLVFICHSMGGIVVKKALIRATISREMRLIASETSSVAFFGTPHRGLDQASVASFVNRLSSAARLTVRNHSSSELKAFSNCLADINTEFTHVASKLQIISFIEQRDTHGLGKVVEDWSSRMDHQNERARVTLDADHQRIVQFKNGSDVNYRRVQQHIVSLVGEARAPRLSQMTEAEDDQLLRVGTADLTILPEVHSMDKEAIVCHSLPPLPPRFFCRDPIVNAMGAHFVGTKNGLHSLALHGMAGAGKTRLALNFANSQREKYPAIFWVHADRDQKMAQDYNDFARELGLDLEGKNGQLQNRNKFKSWLSKERVPWLMIFDNIDSLASVKPYWPSAGHGSIVVTARNPEIITTLVQKAILVGTFSEHDGAKYLLSRLSDPSAQDESLANVITKKVGGLPIALSHIAGFVEATACTFEEVLDMYSYRADPELVDHDSSGITFDYDESYATIWKVSFESLGDEATQLLEMLVLLDPDSIPDAMLRGGSGALTDRSNTLIEPTKYRKGIAQLRRHALVEKNIPIATLSVHRLVQEATIRNWDPLKLQSVFSKVSTCVSHLFPRQIHGASMSKDWERCALFTPHLMSLARHYQYAQPPLERSVDFAEALSHCGWYLYEQGQADQALELTLIALDTCKKILEGKPHLTTAYVYNNLSALYSVQGKRKEAAETSLLVIGIREQILGPDHVDLAGAIENYAADLNSLNRFEEANEFYTNALRIRELPLNAESEPELLGQTLSNAGRCWARIGLYPEAERALEKAIDLRTRSLGVHNATAISYYGLGNVVLAQGRDDEAMKYHKQSLDMRKELKLTTHWLGISYHKMAVLHHRKGQSAQTTSVRGEQNAIAIDYLRKASDNFKQTQPEPGLLARSLFKLSSIIREIGHTTGDETAIGESHRLHDEAIEAAKGEVPEDPSERDFDELVQFDHH